MRLVPSVTYDRPRDQSPVEPRSPPGRRRILSPDLHIRRNSRVGSRPAVAGNGDLLPAGDRWIFGNARSEVGRSLPFLFGRSRGDAATLSRWRLRRFDSWTRFGGGAAGAGGRSGRSVAGHTATRRRQGGLVGLHGDARLRFRGL